MMIIIIIIVINFLYDNRRRRTKKIYYVMEEDEVEHEVVEQDEAVEEDKVLEEDEAEDEAEDEVQDVVKVERTLETIIIIIIKIKLINNSYYIITLLEQAYKENLEQDHNAKAMKASNHDIGKTKQESLTNVKHHKCSQNNLLNK